MKLRFSLRRATDGYDDVFEKNGRDDDFSHGFVTGFVTGCLWEDQCYSRMSGSQVCNYRSTKGV